MRSSGLAGLVAGREIRTRTSSTSFVVGTVLSLVIVAALVVVPALRAHHARVYRVGVVGEVSAPLREAIAHTGTQLGSRVEVVTVDQAEARRQLRSGQLDLVVEGSRSLLLNQALSPDRSSSSLSSLVSAVGSVVALQGGLERAGLSPDQAYRLAHPGRLPVAALVPAPTHPVPLATALIVTVLLFALLQQYGAWVLVGVIEEKSTRVVEVLLSTVRPTALLVGKVVGIGAVALLQAGLTVGVSLGLSALVGSSVLQGSGPAFVAVAMVWFLLGYAFYCWLFAAAGSLVSRQEEAQNVAFPLMLPLIVGYFLAFTAFVAGHASVLVQIMAYVPFTAPIDMPTVMALGQASWWQVALSMLITLGATVVMARLAAGIYDRAVLHTGRQLRWREVLPRRSTPAPETATATAPG